MTPRTACTAIGEVLCQQYGGEFLPKEDILDSQGFIRIQKKHSTLQELIQNGLLTKEDALSLIKFCAVRNPFDSLVSLYIKRKYKYQPLLSDPLSWVNRTPHYAKDMDFCKNHSFDSWIIKNYSKKIIKRFFGMKPSMFNAYTEGVDMVMRYENIHDDFKHVLRRVGIFSEMAIPVVNQTGERTNIGYRTYYSKLSKKIIEYIYYNDLTKFNYKF